LIALGVGYGALAQELSSMPARAIGTGHFFGQIGA
jgi:hypothetical protein